MTEETINEIIIKYLTDESSTEEDKELLTWLSGSEDNRKLFRSLKDAYDLGQFENHIIKSDTAAEWKKLLRQIQSVEKPAYPVILFRKIGRYAAIFILGLLFMKVADVVFTKNMRQKEFITRIETGKGERSKITLPDNSVVWLNACSSISYDQNFGKQTRKINMKGEAYFNVRKDVSKPFLVCSDSLTCRVTGTSFNLHSFDNDDITSLVLIEGAITLEFRNYSTEVRPGELIEFDKTAWKISRHQADMTFHTSWRFGELMFEKITFEELAKRLERNFRVTFVFENDAMKKETFGGTFRYYDSLETILKVISTGTPVKYQIEKDIVYIK